MGTVWLGYGAIAIVCFVFCMAYCVWQGEFDRSSAVPTYVFATIFGLAWPATVPATIFGVTCFYLFKAVKHIHEQMIQTSSARYRKRNR